MSSRPFFVCVLAVLGAGCASASSNGASQLSVERSVMELQRTALTRLLAGIEPYLEDRRAVVICVAPALRTNVRGRLIYAGAPLERRGREPAEWLARRLRVEPMTPVSSLDCQRTDDGWIERGSRRTAVQVSAGFSFRSANVAEVNLRAQRSRRDFLAYRCTADQEPDGWSIRECICTDSGSAGICLPI